MSPILFLVAQLACALPDHGIFPDLDTQVTVHVPPGVTAKDNKDTWLRLDPIHKILTLYYRDSPLKAFPAAIPKTIQILSPKTLESTPLHGGDLQSSSTQLTVRPEDATELARFTSTTTPILIGAPGPREDKDGDGIVDRLDIALGAKKLLFNKARYIERYVSIKYPNGDVPRTEGVCSDTVIRALRNAGIDLQKEIHEDILRAPKSYPMVEKVDASINHRRVKTLLPWFERHFVTLPANTPFLPGDIAFFDTFPSRSGPDHLGIVSDAPGKSGLPSVINNWTDGAVDAEMDLLSFVPVTHHFRAPSPAMPKQLQWPR